MSSNNLDPDLRKVVLKLLISSKMVMHFANNLLDNNALDSQRFVPVLKFASVSGIFQEVIFLMSMEADMREIEIQADLKRIKGCRMKVDKQRI